MKKEKNQTGPLSYRTDALKQLSSLLRIPPTRMAKAVGQSNNITIDRWLKGYDIYTTSLVNLCNLFHLDILSFLTYDDKSFKTNMGDIIKMEQAGLDLRDLLKEKEVEPCTFDECRTLSDATPHDPSSINTTYPATPSIGQYSTPTPEAFIDKLIAFQCQAHEHERQMLEQQRQDLQTVIDDKDRQIAALQKELNRMKKQKPATTPYFGMVADDSELGDK